MKINKVETFSSSSHCPGGAPGLGLASTTGHFQTMFNNQVVLSAEQMLFLQSVSFFSNPELIRSVSVPAPEAEGGSAEQPPCVKVLEARELWGRSCVCNTSVKLCEPGPMDSLPLQPPVPAAFPGTGAAPPSPHPLCFSFLEEVPREKRCFHTGCWLSLYLQIYYYLYIQFNYSLFLLLSEDLTKGKKKPTAITFISMEQLTLYIIFCFSNRTSQCKKTLKVNSTCKYFFSFYTVVL